jgi:type VI secretion system secreted protein VgrG
MSVKKDGTIVIKGKDITLQGSGKITERADGDPIVKGSTVKQN